MELNTRRIWMGGVAGGVLWNIWSFVVGFLVIGLWRLSGCTGSRHLFEDTALPCIPNSVDDPALCSRHPYGAFVCLGARDTQTRAGHGD